MLYLCGKHRITMRKIFAVASLLLACTVAAQAQGWFRQPTPNDTLQSVRVLPDGKVLFQIYAPKAESVAVTGDLPWDKPVRFEKAENGGELTEISSDAEWEMLDKVLEEYLEGEDEDEQ